MSQESCLALTAQGPLTLHPLWVSARPEPRTGQAKSGEEAPREQLEENGLFSKVISGEVALPPTQVQRSLIPLGHKASACGV